MALRIISLLCCKSLRSIPYQIFFIWLLNLVAYAVWCSYTMYRLIFDDNKRSHGFTLEFFNMVFLTILFCMSICTLICGTPFFIFRLHTRATRDKKSLSRKVAQIKLLPKVTYN